MNNNNNDNKTKNYELETLTPTNSAYEKLCTAVGVACTNCNWILVFFLVFVSVLTPVMWVKKVCSYSISIIYTHYFSNNMHACIAYRMCVYKLALVWTFKLFRQWHTRDSSCLCLPFTWLDHYYLFYQIFFPSKIKEKKTHTHTHFSRLY